MRGVHPSVCATVAICSSMICMFRATFTSRSRRESSAEHADHGRANCHRRAHAGMNTAHCTPGAVGRAFSNVDFDSYDRSALHRDELTILDDEKIGVQGSKWQRTGRSKLQRLVRPIEDVYFGIDLTGYRMRPSTLDRTRVRFSSDSVWGILSQVLRTRRVYWEWSTPNPRKTA